MGEPDHPYQLEAFGIFQAAWLDLQLGQHLSSLPATDEIVKQAADKLAAATAAKPAADAGNFLYSTLSAIMDHGSQSPASLDVMLQAYVHATKKLPDITTSYGKGTGAAMGELNWWIAEEADGFNGPLEHGQNAGKASAEDLSNPQFQEQEVKARLDDVLDRTEDWRKDRVRCTLMYAARGRSYALDLVRGKTGSTVIALVDAGFDTERLRWCEAEFIAGTVLLRACAKSLAADTAKVSEWVQKLEAFLCGERVSFAIKSHAVVSLKIFNAECAQLTTSFHSSY